MYRSGERGPDTLGPDYGSPADPAFRARYAARCHCGAVCYEVGADPVDVKL